MYLMHDYTIVILRHHMHSFVTNIQSGVVAGSILEQRTEVLENY